VGIKRVNRVPTGAQSELHSNLPYLTGMEGSKNAPSLSPAIPFRNISIPNGYWTSWKRYNKIVLRCTPSRQIIAL